ncbi:MAG: hypothetical protein U0Q11_18680 [Vicinamibacterales bacterium]
MAKRSAAKKAAAPARKSAGRKKVAAKKAAPAARVLKKSAAAAKTKKAAGKKRAKKPAARGANPLAVLFAPVAGAERKDFGHVQLEVGRAGAARVKRMIYPAGFHWKKDMKPVTGTELCMHAHVGFLVHGEIHIEYADGCVVEHKAPQIVAIDPGHDGWVVGKDPVVLIEFDFERDTVSKLGMPDAHRHA